MVSFHSMGLSLVATAMACAAVISIGCSSNTIAEDTGSQKLASEEDPVCVSASVGDGTTCIEHADLKMDLHMLCEASGRVLTDLSNFMHCPNGDGVVSADYECCAPAPADPNPNPDANGCVYQALGDGTTCQSEADWQAQAAAHCSAQGLFMRDFGVALDCANGESSHVKLGCCVDSAPPAPDPVICSYHPLGDGTACADSDAWTDEAEALCAAEGLVVADLYLAADCAGGASSFGKLACCEP